MKGYSTDILLGKVADALSQLRLNQNLTQQAVADRSGLSLKAVVNLESGNGASLKSFLSVCRTLGKLDWKVLGVYLWGRRVGALAPTGTGYDWVLCL